MYIHDLEQRKNSPKLLDYWVSKEIKEKIKISEKPPEKTYHKINTFKKTIINKK